MDPRDMTLKELWAWLEARMDRDHSAGVGWYAGETEAVRAELKRRCEEKCKRESGIWLKWLREQIEKQEATYIEELERQHK